MAAVGRLLPDKRFDRFLAAVALARRQVPAVHGILVGDGPERQRLERLAQQLGLVPDGVHFLGHRWNLEHLLRYDADVLMLTSDQEGFPNVVLEAMGDGIQVCNNLEWDGGGVVWEQLDGHDVRYVD